jgi:hypothetical protein
MPNNNLRYGESNQQTNQPIDQRSLKSEISSFGDERILRTKEIQKEFK